MQGGSAREVDAFLLITDERNAYYMESTLGLRASREGLRIALIEWGYRPGSRSSGSSRLADGVIGARLGHRVGELPDESERLQAGHVDIHAHRGLVAAALPLESLDQDGTILGRCTRGDPPSRRGIRDRLARTGSRVCCLDALCLIRGAVREDWNGMHSRPYASLGGCQEDDVPGQISGDIELDDAETLRAERLEIEDIVQMALQIAMGTDGFARLLQMQLGEERARTLRSYHLVVDAVSSSSRRG